MKLKALERWHVEAVREWRNEDLSFLRTPYRLTTDMQQDFYDEVVCNRDSKHRYFAIVDGGLFIGMGGLTNIDYVNGNAEVSLIINPKDRHMGYGKRAFALLHEEAIFNLRLDNVWGVVYNTGNVEFWHSVIDDYEGYRVKLPRRKFYNGEYYDAMWFMIQ